MRYLSWRLLGVTSMATTFAFKAFFDGIGKTHVHLVSAMVMNVLNVVALPPLHLRQRHARHPPRWASPGAGLAGLRRHVRRPLHHGRLRSPPRVPQRASSPSRWQKLDRGLTWSILKLSIPSAVATIVVMAGFCLFAMIAEQARRARMAAASPSASGGGRAGERRGDDGDRRRRSSSPSPRASRSAPRPRRWSRSPSARATATRPRPSAGLRCASGSSMFGTIGLLEAIFAPQVLAFVSTASSCSRPR